MVVRALAVRSSCAETSTEQDGGGRTRGVKAKVESADPVDEVPGTAGMGGETVDISTVVALALTTSAVDGLPATSGVGYVQALRASREDTARLARLTLDAARRSPPGVAEAELGLVCAAVRGAAEKAGRQVRSAKGGVVAKGGESTLIATWHKRARPTQVVRLREAKPCIGVTVGGSKRTRQETATRLEAALALLDLSKPETEELERLLLTSERADKVDQGTILGQQQELVLEVVGWLARHDALVTSLASLTVAIAAASTNETEDQGAALQELREAAEEAEQRQCDVPKDEEEDPSREASAGI